MAPGFADRILIIELADVSLFVMGPAALGLIIGAFLVGIFAGKILKGSVILTGIIATGICLILISLFSISGNHGIIYPIVFLLFILGLSNSFINVPTSTILQEETDKDLRGRVYGVLTSLTGGFSILPVLFSGLLADAIGIQKTLFIIGIIVFLSGIYYLRKRIGVVF